jgi:methionine-rich copper-binding protein CopC
MALAALIAAGATVSAAPLHFALAKSMPEADTSVESLETIELWFTQVPQDESVAVRLVDAQDSPMEAGAPAPAAQDGKHISLACSR